MPVYNPPLRDMQFVLHELLHVADEFKALPSTQRPMPTPSMRCSKKGASSHPKWSFR